ncbi:Glyoxalase-like domain-containing protein [Tenacibaculum sp. MAR_2009_124]|nr:Glyoxalase-like domain-containing protein [Tenacibaculum sp. MAR_2009_124]
MKYINILICLSLTLMTGNKTNTKNKRHMKLNAGIITEHFTETKKFYTKTLGFGISFENEFYLLLHTPNHEAEVSFLKPNHESQKPIFQPAFQGKGVYFTIEVDDVDSLYNELQKKDTKIITPIRNEPWGDRHFTIVDPNGIGIDIVTYTDPNK